MVIRKATIEDLPKMEGCARRFYNASQFLKNFDAARFVALWTNLLDRDMGVIFLLHAAGEIRGAIGGVVYPDTYSQRLVATEFFWWVDPSERGSAGIALYHKFEAWARQKHCDEIRMVHLVDSMPEKLERVYRHWGYTPCEVHYRKELAA